MFMVTERHKHDDVDLPPARPTSALKTARFAEDGVIECGREAREGCTLSTACHQRHGEHWETQIANHQARYEDIAGCGNARAPRGGKIEESATCEEHFSSGGIQRNESVKRHY